VGEGKLKPQEVKLGLRGEGAWEVLSGLEAGARVVTQGNFLLAAESRLRSAPDSQLWSGGAHDAH
jgi:membrane fusion protein, copper/silver efflux system